MNTAPPKLAQKLLRWFIKDELLEEVLGDLEEKFELDMEVYSASKARRIYWYQAMQYLRPFAIKRSKHSINTTMFRHYFKISWRSILRSKSFSTINILGLSVGLTACFMILLYVASEMGYDQYHDGAERIYRIASEAKGDKWMALSAPVGPGLKENLPEIEQMTRLCRFPGAEKVLLTSQQDDNRFFENNVYYVDSTFLDLFSYDFKYGNRDALTTPNSMVITEEISEKLFGKENPVGKALTVGLPFGDMTYTIHAVIQDKGKSHIPVSVLLSINNHDVGKWIAIQNSWVFTSIFHTYVKLKQGVSSQAFEEKLQTYYNEKAEAELEGMGFTKTVYLQSVGDIYLHSNNSYEVAANGNINHLRIFSSVALFLLIIACINFMNLSTAKSERRIKEVGLRKVVGADRKTLVMQFLSESVLITTLAMGVALILVIVLLPYFNQLIGKDLSAFSAAAIVPVLVGATLLTGIIAGLYPALYLSSFQFTEAFKGKLKNSFSARLIRQGMVIFQYTVSVVLILGVVFISRQMNFMSSQSLGFDNQQKLILPLQTAESFDHVLSLKTALLSNSSIDHVALGGSYPGIENVLEMLFFAEQKRQEDAVDIQTVYAGGDYFETLGIQLLNGRFLSKEFNDTESVVLNESAIHDLGYTVDNAIGKKVFYAMEDAVHELTVIGVVADYHYESLHRKIQALALTSSPTFHGPINYLILDLNTPDFNNAVADVQKLWDEINTSSPFAYSFLDRDFELNYKQEQLTLRLIQYFTLIAIVVACLGLFALSAYTAERRAKEIGIRKVLGARVDQIVSLLSGDFVRLVIIAIMIAIPIAYYAASRWLEQFAYSIDLSWWVFALVSVLVVALALLTVSFQSIKTGLANPVKSLRSE